MRDVEASPKAMASVWLATVSHDLGAMHDGICIVAPDGPRRFFHCELNPEPRRPVSGVLAAAGFSGAYEGSPVVVDVLDGYEVAVVFHRGFRVPQSKIPNIELMVYSALAGNLGGYTSVVAGLVAYQRSAMLAFEYVLSAADNPPVLVRHPGVPAGAPGQLGPGSIVEASLEDSRMHASLARSSHDF